MANRFFLVFLAFSLSFCSKKDDSLSNPPGNSTPVTTFKFTVNGTEYNWNGSLAETSAQGSIFKKKTSNNYGEGYLLEATNGNFQNYDFWLELPQVVELKAQTFNITRANYPLLGIGAVISPGTGTHYGQKTGDYSNLTISKIENGYATGTFNAVWDGVAITGGVFTNVKILK